MPEPHHESPQAALNPIEDQSPLAPFQQPVFRMLWITWLMANICMWMSDVAGAWTMTSLNASPLWVALVQSAASLPVFLLGIPSGALADILDRKRYFLFTQIWVAGVACLLSLVVFLDILSPGLLLLLIFANGVGLAMRWPVFSAIVPELVPRMQLPAALALNGVSMNASRIIGPLLAGALIASFGSVWVFLLNALLSLLAALMITLLVVFALCLVFPPRRVETERARAVAQGGIKGRQDADAPRPWFGGLSRRLNHIWAREGLFAAAICALNLNQCNLALLKGGLRPVFGLLRGDQVPKGAQLAWVSKAQTVKG